MPEPLLRFVVGGVQKGGTTAMAEALARHPAIAMPNGKELHAFDAADFDDGWDSAQVDARIAPHFGRDGGRLHGDATPLNVYHPGVVRRIARYNPAMRWILLLRDPVERAISHYHMEFRRGRERRGLFAAVFAEPFRLHGAAAGFAPDASWRWASYVDRGRYVRQLDGLYSCFPRSQVLVLRSADLLADPVSTLGRVTGFLQLPPVPATAGRVFVGEYAAPPRLSPGRLLLRWRLRGEIDRLREHHGIDLRANG